MATKGTPKGGLSEIAKRMYLDGADVTLIAYTNAPNSLGANTAASDLTQPTQAAGYAPILLDGIWSEIDGVATYAHSVADPVLGAKPLWTATGPWNATVNGVAMIFGSRVMHFKDNVTPFVAAAGKKLVVDISNLIGP